jgi:hypothetical protein
MSHTDLIQPHRTSERPRHALASLAPRLSPFIEKAILFGTFSAAAGFWMAMIWWIVR